MEDCVFCLNLIKGGEEIVFFTEKFYAIYDRSPINEGHLLIIPRRHSRDLFTMSEAEWKDFPVALLRAQSILDKRFNPDGYNVLVNCGEDAGQTVMHTHIHILPRYKNKGLV